MSVQIVLGSKSDLKVAEKATGVLKELGIKYKISVASAHRTPELVDKLVAEADAEVFIAIAGLSAALPGVIAARTSRPVIGVPVSGALNLDSILSVVQMPPGIPVAAVGQLCMCQPVAEQNDRRAFGLACRPIVAQIVENRVLLCC